MSAHFEKIDLEIAASLEAFSHGSYSYSDSPDGIYALLNRGELSNDALIALFIRDFLGGDAYPSLQVIPSAKANMLLRQMAMLEVQQTGQRKNRYSSSEAKWQANLLMDFLGKKVEYFSNVGSADKPHDEPGKVIHNDNLYGEHRSICFFAITEQYLVYTEQAWDFRGE